MRRCRLRHSHEGLNPRRQPPSSNPSCRKPQARCPSWHRRQSTRSQRNRSLRRAPATAASGKSRRAYRAARQPWQPEDSATRLVDKSGVWHPGAGVGLGEGFRMPAGRALSRRTGAGVRKPPRKEPAGSRCAVCRLWGFDGAACWVGDALAGVVGGGSTITVASLPPRRWSPR